jgi:HB1, ASXL, restriction endonuclease HTH domain
MAAATANRQHLPTGDRTMTAKKNAKTPTTPKKQKKAARPATPPADDATATVAVEPAAAEQAPAEQPPAEPTAPAAAPERQPLETPGSANERKRRRAQQAAKRQAQKAEQGQPDSKEKKLSALDAAAKVLGETGQALTCQEMIDAMAAKGYWTSPGGQTPAATLYSAILRELTTKGADARFVKTERGKFARTGAL